MLRLRSRPKLKWSPIGLAAVLACLCGCSDSDPAGPRSNPSDLGAQLVGGATVLVHDYDGNTNDSSENSHNGVAFGNPSFADVCLGQALAFDGVDDYVSVANTPVLQPSFVTVEVRFKPARVFRNGTTFEPILVKLPSPYDFGTRVDGYDIAYQDPFGTGGRIGFGIGSQNGTTRVHASAYETLRPERFYYVAGTYDGSEIRLYIDGRLVATRAHNQPIAYLGGPIRIGGNIRHSLIVPGNAPQFFDGQIDFVAIHSRALSAEEIAQRARMAIPCED